MARANTGGTRHLSVKTPVSKDVTITTSDHIQLSGRLYQPSAPPKALVICAHAMMVDMRTFEKSGFVNALSTRGYAVFVFNFRGRDEKAPLDWSYDELVRLDVPAVIDTVNQHCPTLAKVWLGHSLGGHVGLAAMSTGHLGELSGMVLVSTNVWLPSLESNFTRRRLKSIYMMIGRLLVLSNGTIPVKRFNLGTVDEAKTYLRDLMTWWRNDRWSSSEDGESYFAGLANLECPLLSVVGSQDKLEAHPTSVRAFLNAFGPKNSQVLIADADWTEGRVPTDHMRLITSRHSAPGWQHIADWLDALPFKS
ncbi:MAG: alpha/beta fold hydrolase [Bradymonadia bacterium]